jgi:hypothetical protein
MSDWDIIVPEATQNYVDNPSFEFSATDGWTNYSSGAAAGNRTRNRDEQRFGAHSMELEKTGGAQADQWGLSQATPNSVSGQVYIASAWVMVGTGCTLTLQVDKGAGVGVYQTVNVQQTDTSGEWVFIETPVLTANATADAMVLYVYIAGTATVSAYVDAIQYELKSYPTTYCDGEQEGCEWTGAEHNSDSLRSAQSRAGGRVYDLEDSFNLDIGDVTGPGMPPISQILDEYALLPGGAVQGYKQHARTFVLSGLIRGTSQSDLHDKRQSLIDILSPSSYPNNQPITVRYTGASVDKECRCYYEGGLEYGVSASDDVCWGERVAFRFLQADPAWYEVGESAMALDHTHSETYRYMAGRLRSTSRWDDLGLTNNPGGGGSIGAVCQASDGTVYYGGGFTNLNQAGTGMDYCARYHPTTDTWSVLVGASDLSSQVNAIVEGADGTIYLGGGFTDVNGAGANTHSYVIAYNPTADTWSNLGTPVQGAAAITSVYGLDWGNDGKLYIVGDFDNWANIANADGVVVWDGAAYAALGAPGIAGAQYALCVKVHPSLDVYVGGTFTAAGGAAADYGVRWSNAASAWGAIGPGGFSTFVQRFAVDSRNFVYIVGAFLNLGDANGDYAVRFNGTGFESLGTGLNLTAQSCAIGPDDVLYVVGAFTDAGGVTVNRGTARWNGASWAALDVVLPGTPVVYAVDVGPSDPVIPQNYDIWLGWDTTGAGYGSDIVTVTNDGTENAYPRITVRRVGGTDGTLYQIRNETTGKELLFDYTILDGEMLTINLDPLNKSIVSSMFGDRMDAILRNCDFGDWALQPGDNLVTCFMQGNVPATVDMNMIWRDTYGSLD